MLVGLREKILIILMPGIILLGAGSLFIVNSMEQSHARELVHQQLDHYVQLHQAKILASIAQNTVQSPVTEAATDHFTRPQVANMSARVLDENGAIVNQPGMTIWNELPLEAERLQLKTAMVKLKSGQQKSARIKLTMDGIKQAAAMTWLPSLQRYLLATQDVSHISPPDNLDNSTAGLNLMLVLCTALMVIFSFILLVMHRLLIINLRHLLNGVRQMAASDYQTRLVLERADELGQITQAFNLIAGKLEKVQGQLQASQGTLHASEQRFATIFNAVPDPILITRLEDGAVVDVNQAFQRRSQLSHQQAIMLSQQALGLWSNQEEQSMFHDILLRQKQVRGFECDTQLNGVARRDSISAAIIELDGKDHILSISHDVTEMRKQEAALRASEARLRQSYEILARVQKISGMGIWQWQVETNLIYWSKTIYDIYQITPPLEADAPPGYVGSLPGTRLLDLIHPEDRPLWLEQVHSILHQGGHNRVQVRALRPDGTIRYVVSQGDIGEMQGDRVVNAYGFIQDVTELRQKELALHQSLLAQQAAEAAQQTAEAATRMKGEFLAMISHEVRTPLGGVIGMLRFGLKDLTLSGDTRAKLSVGLANAEVLLQIINDILDYSKLEAGKMSIELIDFDLPGLVRDAVAIMEERAETKGLSLLTELPADLSVWWHGDPTRLRQVLINLIGNAIKFTETGSVKVRVRVEPNGEVTFMVRDTGIGISTEAVRRLFQKYQQADESIARKFGGTGLGLAICKRIVEAMDGTIQVASKLDVGSTFTVRLPLKPGKVNLIQASIAHLEPHHCQLHILCAEDGATNQIIIRELVSAMGHHIDLAEDGIEALTALSLDDYDLVLMDSRMPRLEGIEALRLLRQKACEVRNPSIPVIALTANVSEAERERFFHAGADGFIGKPIDEAQLHAEIGRMITLLLASGRVLPINPLASGRNLPINPRAHAPRAPRPGLAAPAPSVAAPSMALPSTPKPPKPATGSNPLSNFSSKMQQNLITMFSDEAPRLLAEITRGLEAQQANVVAIAAHSLKGCSGYFDAPQLQQLCKQIETAANANDLASVRQHLPTIGLAVENAVIHAKQMRPK